jgi:hypothetical protein
MSVYAAPGGPDSVVTRAGEGNRPKVPGGADPGRQADATSRDLGDFRLPG